MQRDTVELARDGDHDAFTELARAAMDRQFAIATLILRDGELAKDAVQEALVTAWRSIQALRDPDAWDAWLHRLTVRTCYRLAKRQRRRELVELQIVPRPSPDPAGDFTLSIAERERIERVIGRLSLEQRAVLVLHYYADLTTEQAAATLDIPVGTAKSRLHYGLRALRASLEEEAAAEYERNGRRTA